MTKTELIKLMYKIHNVDFDTEIEYDQALKLFLDNVPDPEASRLIYNIKPQLTPEEVVEKALAYKPVILPPPDDMIESDSK